VALNTIKQNETKWMFFILQSSTRYVTMAKLFYFKGLVKKLQAKGAKQVSLDDFFKKQ
jgi:hypothetical protein